MGDELERLRIILDEYERERWAIKGALGLQGGGIGLPLAEHVRRVVNENAELHRKVKDLMGAKRGRRSSK